MATLVQASKRLAAATALTLAAALVLLSVDVTSNAATIQWDGGGANTNWSTANNWVGNVAPTSADQTDLEFGTAALVAPSNTTANNTVNDFNLNSISFGDTAGTLFILSGSQIEMKKDGTVQPSINQNSSFLQTISLPVKVSGDELTLTGIGTGLVTISGAITNGKPLIKNGTSTYLLSANNNQLNAATTINGGTIIVANTNALDTNMLITVNNTGTLAVNTGLTYGRTVTFNSGSTLAGKGTYTPSAAFSVGNNVTIAPGIGDIGTLAMGVNTTFAAGSLFAVSVGAGANTNDRLNVTGTLNTSAATNMLLLSMSGADQGKYTLALATTALNIGTNTSANGGFGSVSGLDSAYYLNTTSTAIELLHKATMAIDGSAADATIITGGATSLSGHVANTAIVNSGDLTYTLSGSSGVSGLPGGTQTRTAGDANAAAGALYGGSFTSATVGANNVQITATGTNAATVTNSPQSVSYDVDVLAHSNASFDAGSDLNLLAINFGPVAQGAGGGVLNSFFDVFARVDVANFTAGLDLDLLDSIGNTGTLAVSGLGTFSNLAAGANESYSVNFDTNTPGPFAATYTFKLSDQNLPGATAPESELLTLTVTGIVIAAVPEPATLGLMLMGGGLISIYRRKRAV